MKSSKIKGNIHTNHTYKPVENSNFTFMHTSFDSGSEIKLTYYSRVLPFLKGVEKYSLGIFFLSIS